MNDTTELAPITTLEIPGQYYLRNGGFSPRHEIKRLAVLLERGTVALGGCYMRLCHVIRESELDNATVRELLLPHFPPARVSEILRVSHSSEDVWKRYSFGVFGFKAALRECRTLAAIPTEDLRRRKIRRTAERLVLLARVPMVIELVEWTVTIASG